MKLLQTTNKLFYMLRPVNSYINSANNLRLCSLKTCIVPFNDCHSIRCNNKQNLLLVQTVKDFKRPYKNDLDLTSDTYIMQDATLFTNDNTKFYRIVVLFGISQCIFWTYLGYVAATTMKDTPVSQKELDDAYNSFAKKDPKFVSLWRRLNLGKFKSILATFCEVAGFSAIFFSVAYMKRSIKCLILRKGGREVAYKVFSFFGDGGKMKKLPLNHISAQQSRRSEASFVALKFKQHFFYYILDTSKGKFHNPDLFDRTIGLRRVLK